MPIVRIQRRARRQKTKCVSLYARGNQNVDRHWGSWRCWAIMFRPGGVRPCSVYTMSDDDAEVTLEIGLVIMRIVFQPCQWRYFSLSA